MWLRWKMDGMSHLARTELVYPASSSTGRTTMDTADHGSQTANVNGDGNTVIIVNGDMYGACPPPPNCPTPAPITSRKPRRRRRWLGTYAGVLTVVSTAALGISMFLPPDADPTKTSTASARIAVTPLLSPSARVAVNAPVSRPVRTAADARVPRPARTAASSPPSPPVQWPHETSALCRDRTFSSSERRSGTCSWHGGVAHWRYDEDHPYWRRG